MNCYGCVHRLDGHRSSGRRPECAQPFDLNERVYFFRGGRRQAFIFAVAVMGLLWWLAKCVMSGQSGYSVANVAVECLGMAAIIGTTMNLRRGRIEIVLSDNGLRVQRRGAVQMEVSWQVIESVEINDIDRGASVQLKNGRREYTGGRDCSGSHKRTRQFDHDANEVRTRGRVSEIFVP